MIPTPTVAAAQVCTTSRAHVEAVATRHNLPIVPAGGYLYTVRRVPLLGQPIIYRAPVAASERVSA